MTQSNIDTDQVAGVVIYGGAHGVVFAEVAPDNPTEFSGFSAPNDETFWPIGLVDRDGNVIRTLGVLYGLEDFKAVLEVIAASRQMHLHEAGTATAPADADEEDEEEEEEEEEERDEHAAPAVPTAPTAPPPAEQDATDAASGDEALG